MINQRANQLVEAGLWLRLSGDLEGAKKLFEQALELDPKNRKARELIDAPMATVFPSLDSPLKEEQPPKTEELAKEQRTSAPGKGRESPKKTKSELSEKQKPPRKRKRTEPGEVKEPAAKRQGKVEFTELEAFNFGEPDANTEATSPNQTFNELEMDDDLSVVPELDTDWGEKIKQKSNQAVPPGNGEPADLLDSVDIELVEPPPPPSKKGSTSKKEAGVKTLLKGAQDLLELDDHTGAMELILKAQALAPNDPKVQRMREKSEQVLQTMFESKLGSMSSRPRVVLKEDEIIWLNLDHRAGFVLAQIDGSVTFDDLFAVSGMSRLDTARILAQLVDEGVIKV